MNEDLTQVSITWKHTGDAEFPYTAEVAGRTYTIRINDFPAEPLYTLISDGTELTDLEDWPRAWVMPAPPKALLDMLTQPRRVDGQRWAALFGRPADDPEVARAVAAAGVTKALTIGDDELDVSADLPRVGITIGFRDDAILNPNGGITGRPILASVMMLLQHPRKADLYDGPLPHGLTKDTPRDALRARFGPPLESEDDLHWDAWHLDGLRLTVTYTRDFASIARVALALPEPS